MSGWWFSALGQLGDAVHERDRVREALELQRPLERAVDLRPALGIRESWRQYAASDDGADARPDAEGAAVASSSCRSSCSARWRTPGARAAAAAGAAAGGGARRDGGGVVGGRGCCGRGRSCWAAVLLQVKTLLDGADGQLARASGRVTVLGRYLDSESDLLVDAFLFAALGHVTGRWWLAVVAFVVLALVLSFDFELELALAARARRAARGAAAGDGAAERPRPDLRRRLRAAGPAVDWFVERRFAARRRRRGAPITTARRCRCSRTSGSRRSSRCSASASLAPAASRRLVLGAGFVLALRRATPSCAGLRRERRWRVRRTRRQGAHGRSGTARQRHRAERGRCDLTAAVDARTCWFDLPPRRDRPGRLGAVPRGRGGDLRGVRDGSRDARHGDTPERFLRALLRGDRGLRRRAEARDDLPGRDHGTRPTRAGQIIEGPIEFHCLCEHHALPFFGTRTSATSRASGSSGSRS